jgi:hypothetical protein
MNLAELSAVVSDEAKAIELVERLRWLQIPTKSPADSEMMSPGDTR